MAHIRSYTDEEKTQLIEALFRKYNVKETGTKEFDKLVATCKILAKKWGHTIEGKTIDNFFQVGESPQDATFLLFVRFLLDNPKAEMEDFRAYFKQAEPPKPEKRDREIIRLYKADERTQLIEALVQKLKVKEIKELVAECKILAKKGNLTLEDKTISNFFQPGKSWPQDATFLLFVRFLLDDPKAEMEDFRVYLKQKQTEPPTPEKKRGWLWVYLLSGLLFLFIAVKVWWLPTKPELDLNLALTIQSEKYLNDPTLRDFFETIKQIFESKNPHINLHIDPKHDSDPSLEEFKHHWNNGGTDIIIGAPPEIHEYYHHYDDTTRTAQINIQGLNLPPEAIGPDRRWVVAYYGLMGMAYNASRQKPHSALLNNWQQWLMYLAEKNYHCPGPGSAGAFALIYNLGLTSTGGFDQSLGMTSYQDLYLEMSDYDQKAPTNNPLLGLACGEMDFEAVFLHDLIWKTSKLGFPAFHETIRWMLPEGGVEMVCISIRKRKNIAERDKYLDAANEFVRFYLSPEIQAMQYDYHCRIPVDSLLRDSVLTADTSSFSCAVQHFFSTNKYPRNSREYFKSIKKEDDWKEYCKTVFKLLGTIPKPTKKIKSGHADERSPGNSFTTPTSVQ